MDWRKILEVEKERSRRLRVAHRASESAHYADNLDHDSGGLVGIILQNKLILLGTLAVCLTLGIAAIVLITPKFEAETLLLIEPQDNQAAVVQPVAAGLGRDAEAVRSETYIISSGELINRVISRLNLASDSELNPDGNTISDSPDGSESSQISHSKLVDRFRESARVNVVADSRVLSIRFNSVEPVKAQRIANSMANEYLLLREEMKLKSSSRLTSWLDGQISSLREQLQEKEAGIEELRRQYGMVEGTRGDLRTQELAQVSTQLIMARAERAGAEARLDQAQLLSDSDDDARTANEVVNSPLIQDLRMQETALQRRQAELSSELGDKHPRMLQMKADISELRTKIDFEINNIMSGLQNQLNIAKARERSLGADLNSIKNSIAEISQNEIEIRSLEREMGVDQTLLASLLMRQKETAPQEKSEFLQTDVRIISEARIPTKAAYPNKSVILGFSLFGSILLGGLIILFREMMEKGFRSTEQLDEQTGVTSLGFIPQTDFGPNGSGVTNYLADHPTSAFAESLRTLMWSINLTFSSRRPKVLAITSSTANEGKSTLSIGLCVSQANRGTRTLIIDADIRKPEVHDSLKVESHPGLVDYLMNEATLDQIIKPSDVCDGIDVIPSGDKIDDVPRLLGSDRMSTLLKELRIKYDLIVIDTPPTLVGADVQLISRIADVTILAVRWGSTSRKSVRHSIKLLETAGATLAGTVLSVVNVSKYSKYNYGDSGAYAGNLAKYYGRA